MLQKEFTEQETLFIFLENAKKEGFDLTAFQNQLFAVIRRMYVKGMGWHAWQGSQEYARFPGRGNNSLRPVQFQQAPPPPQPQLLPSQPGPQPIQPGRPLPEMQPIRPLPPYPVPAHAPLMQAPMPVPGPMPGPEQWAPPGPPVIHPGVPSGMPAAPVNAPPGPPLIGGHGLPSGPAPTPPPELPINPEMPSRT